MYIRDDMRRFQVVIESLRQGLYIYISGRSKSQAVKRLELVEFGLNFREIGGIRDQHARGECMQV